MATQIIWTREERAIVAQEVMAYLGRAEEAPLLINVQRALPLCQLKLPEDRRRSRFGASEAAWFTDAVLDLLAPRLWTIQGYGSFTPEQMVDMLRDALPIQVAVLKYQAAYGVSPVDEANAWRTAPPPAALKTQVAETLAQKTGRMEVKRVRRKVVVAGIRPKNHQALERKFPDLQLVWITDDDDVRSLRAKTNGNLAVVCLHGVSGSMINVIKGVSSNCRMGEGVSFVESVLQTEAADVRRLQGN